MMKITLDIDQLLSEGVITQAEYEKLSGLATKSTGSLAFSILIGFGVIAVSGATFALVPAPATSIVIGLLILVAGLGLLLSGSEQWKVLSNICILVGALMAGGGVVTEFKGSPESILSVTAIFSVASIFARSSLLAVLATLMLSASIGEIAGKVHASEPTIIVILFSLLAIGLHQLSKRVSVEYERIALASARTGVLIVNFGFWVGSLCSELFDSREVIISDSVFAVLWAVALLVTAIWSWKSNRRWVLNTVATFGCIHFFTQMFVNLDASPGTVLIAGLLALGFAVGLRNMNNKMKQNT